MKKYFQTLERFEQFERKSVHILPTTQKGNCRYKLPIQLLGAELYRKVVKKYFLILKRLEQFDKKCLLILPTAHKGNCTHNVTLPPLRTEL